jgi:DNA-directed RNA polymerase specialized sigma24 family protein
VIGGNRVLSTDVLSLHRAALLRRAVHLLHNEAEAEDLVQDTLVGALSDWRKLRSDLHVRAWLFQRLRWQYLIFMASVHAEKRGGGVRNIALSKHDMAIPGAQEATIELKETFRHLTTLQDGLALWAFVFGERIASIAAAEGISEMTMTQRISRARKRLR